MMKRTTYEFEFPMTDHMDSAEFASLVKVINELYPNGEITGEAVKSDTYKITVETMDAA